jgi:uncharacterized protein
VLRSTFVHLTGIGPVGEAQLWRSGIDDWSQLLDRLGGLGLDDGAQRRLAAEIGRSEQALAEEDAAWFARCLPDREHWRVHPAFRGRTAFLDIETTGLSPYAGIVTVVAVHGGGATRTFVAGDSLEELPAYLRRFGVLVTFNGRQFDVPFLEATFPQFVPPPLHIDLRFLLYRLGHAGGLKRIEQRLGVGDRSGVEGVDGLEAVRLWQEWRRGNSAALDRLIRYNRADTVNLEPLLDLATTELARRLRPGSSPPAPPGSPAAIPAGSG